MLNSNEISELQVIAASDRPGATSIHVRGELAIVPVGDDTRAPLGCARCTSSAEKN